MLLAIVFWTATGSICAYLANKNQKNPFFWFTIGLFFGLFGVFAAFYKFKYKIKKRKAKELLAKTKNTTNVVPPIAANKLWFYLDEDNNASSSMSIFALKKKYDEGVILEDTLVWNEDMPAWQQIKELPNTITSWLLPHRE